MLTQIDTPIRHNAFDHERSNIIKAIEDIFHHRHDSFTPMTQLGRKLNPTNYRSITRLSMSMLQQLEERVHYELLSVVPIKESLAVVRVLQTPLDKDGKRIEDATTSPLLVIAKSDDEWEMVGLPLPLHCLIAAGHKE